MNSDKGLKQAARDYVRALEDEDSPSSSVSKAKDKLAEAAMLWVQGEAISKVDAKRMKQRTEINHPQADCGDPDCDECNEAAGFGQGFGQ